MCVNLSDFIKLCVRVHNFSQRRRNVSVCKNNKITELQETFEAH